MATSTLPGTGRAYHLTDGQGDRYLVANQLVTVLARPEDTSNLLEIAIASGGPGTTVPRHHHPAGHECLLVLDGTLDLTIGNRRHRLTRGAFASIPPGVSHGSIMQQHYTRVLIWAVGGQLTKRIVQFGSPTAQTGYPTGPRQPVTRPSADVLAACDVVFEPAPLASVDGEASTVPPADMSPFVLASGNGEWLIAAEQVFAFNAHNGNTGNRFLVVSTTGPAGEKIPNHFHEKHTETFFCLDGRMTMWIEGKEVAIAPGDFVHAPAHTVHAYRLDAPFTRFIGVLAPGIFEPFFRTLCDPYDSAMFPATPGPLRFDRVMKKIAELDLKVVDPPRRPPQAGGDADQRPPQAGGDTDQRPPQA